MTILSGKEIAKETFQKLQKLIKDYKLSPQLDIIIIAPNNAVLSYIKMKKQLAAQLKIDVHIHEFNNDSSVTDIIKKINELNLDNECNGMFIQYPIPDKFLVQKLHKYIDPNKDIDGLTPFNGGNILQGDTDVFLPATPKGILTLLEKVATLERVDYAKWIKGKNVVIINHSNIVGKPLALLLINQNATVTVCNVDTKDLKQHTQKADILITAVGKPNLITKEIIQEDAIVIDAGIDVIDGKVQGDVDFEDVKIKASYITPDPGGVGPMTVISLLENVVKAAFLKENN